MSDELKEDLKTLGATDDEINNIKSEKDMTDLVDKLITGGGTTGNSSSSSSSDTGSNDSFDDDNDNDLPTAKLPVGDGSLPGSMGSSGDGNDNDLPIAELGTPTVGGRM